jgi:hypothetical protein
VSHIDVQPAPFAESNQAVAGWNGGRAAALVIGLLLVIVSLVLLGGAGTGLWAEAAKRDAGYLTTDTHAFSSEGAALVTKSTKLGSSGWGRLYSPGLLGKVRIRVTPSEPDAALFVGIGRSTDVGRYLAGVKQTVISEFFDNKVDAVDGGLPGSAPGAQHFWVASDSGRGDRTVFWKPSDGSWTVVVMNADGRPGVDVRADLGARVPAMPWIAGGLLAAGVVFLAGGVLLSVGAARGRRGRPATT